VWSRDGRLVASLAQEGLMRPRGEGETDTLAAHAR
jgi:acyl-CoA thioesterase